MKILIATDGSQPSLAMLDALIARIGWFAERPAVELLYVHLPVPYGRAAAWAGKEAVERYYEEESQAQLAPARQRLDAAGIPYTAARRVGDPATEIVKQAVDGACDLIAMGTHGHTALQSLVMGSVATKVVATSRIPVMLFHH